MKVYIAGAISNNTDYVDKFWNAENTLLIRGFKVLNPVKNLGFTYREYIDMGLCELMKCDAIYLLKGWESSKGAQLEKLYSETCGLTVMYEGGE